MTHALALGARVHAAAVVAFAATACSTPSGSTPSGSTVQASAPQPVRTPAAPPLEYRAKFTKTPPTLKGGLESGAWAGAPWTASFVDIEGPSKPAPAFRTRVKMLWDSKHLYVAAEMEEPHLWATLTKHDEIVFHDNDFEVFIDPDGDTKQYYEIEVNALKTIFDLFLHRTYREGGPADHNWNCEGLRVEVTLKGTLNDAADLDLGWLVQLSIPWSALHPPEAQVQGAAPQPGDAWRINFSRVEWRNNHEPRDPNGVRLPRTARTAGTADRDAPYAKVPNLREDNWVWSPQWTIDMHLPQFWGRVIFERTP